VPIVEHGPDSPYLDGALFCILLAGLVWLERVRSDQVAVAVTVVVATAIVGAIVGPRLDSRQPWFNYENFAEKLEPTKAEAFSWTHSYGPMTWSRDGREMLRIKASTPAYWKATNLDEFDGVRWRTGPPSRDAPIQPRFNRRWLQTIKVVDRGLRSTQFVGAGDVRDILPGASRLALPQSDGTFVTSSKPLRPGDSYQALVYVPHPATRSSSAPARATPATPRTSSSCTCPCAARPSASWTRPRASRSAPPPTSASPPTAPTARPASCGPAASASSRPAPR
jgi:hypothetical protein